MKKSLFIFILFLFSVILMQGIISCKKTTFLTQGGNLSFSVDTLRFDTLFTTMGSVTRSFKIYNDNKQAVRINQIRLENGQQSAYRMNIDGVATQAIQNVEIAPNDSIYVFVAITIDPTSATNPFIVQDKVLITLNENTSEIPLEAFGQDAHYIVGEILDSQTWINDKPYVIIHSALVDTNAVLTIQKGCRIYMHQDSKLYVAGTLNVFGTKTDSVIFQGDRLDRDYFGYKDYPGEWRGIDFLNTGWQSIMNYCIVKNAGISDAAILVRPPDKNLGVANMLEMNNCTIANSASYGVLCINSKVLMNNCLVHTCGLQSVAMIEGGDYRMNFCTIATYGGIGINHAQQPSVAILNYRDTSLTGYTGANLNLIMNNCVVDGSLEDEIVLAKKNNWTFSVSINHCAFKRKTALDNALVSPVNTLFNVQPQFKDYAKWDFHIEATSALKGAGISVPIVIEDMDGIPRPNPPSIGCYEAL
ncbi:MAG: hypothetical protein R2831_07730 [Chitinophagaceae bacterium]